MRTLSQESARARDLRMPLCPWLQYSLRHLELESKVDTMYLQAPYLERGEQKEREKRREGRAGHHRPRQRSVEAGRAESDSPRGRTVVVVRHCRAVARKRSNERKEVCSEFVCAVEASVVVLG